MPMKLPVYGGVHPNTAALKNVLAAQGVKAPHTGQPFSEAMLLGVGGGLGAGYILWEFKWHESAIIVLGFCNRWNYAAEHMATLCKRLGFQPKVQETGGTKGAAANLQAALDSGTPVVAWVDKAHLPHQQLPEALKGHCQHIVGVHGKDGDSILIDDLGDSLYPVPAEIFAAGRARIGSDKNRLVCVEPGKTDLPAAVMAGLSDHLEHLGRDSESFSLPVYKKWAKLMTDTKNQKGWPVVFKNRKGLYDTLRSIYEGVMLDGTEGAGLRELFADFLDEAAPVVGKPALKHSAGDYRKLGNLWRAFAEAALPGAAFGETRDLMQKRYSLFKRGKLDEMRAVSDRLEALQAQLNRDFPLDDAAVNALFAELSAHLTAIYDAETSALNRLREAVS